MTCPALNCAIDVRCKRRGGEERQASKQARRSMHLIRRSRPASPLAAPGNDASLRRMASTVLECTSVSRARLSPVVPRLCISSEPDRSW
eukprot:scaffold882_cov154-Pinguiococcus_pyrenoidosus.AAC.3